ncbi:capsule biosynthesis protein [Coralliovum pocilloporae]|uniref:capsule biosynthesis protein n=1 Tax=Coralliovum pocilloporae TaxID=3066369 RepID=UPI003307C0D8
MRSLGVRCLVINFSLGDWICTFGLGARNYVGKVRNWRDYLERFVDENNITDIVYYADQRPYHRIARSVARHRGLNVYAYEFGYFRPDWITLERGGMGVFSHFPNDPEQIRELAKDIEFDEPDTFYPYQFKDEAFFEVIYHLVPFFFPYLFPHYRKDRYYNPLLDYLSYIPRLLRSKANDRKAQSAVEALVAEDVPFFVVAMQMQSDYQIRRASPYTHLSEMITEVVDSFVDHAPENSKLVFKLHPLDNGYENWPKVISNYAEQKGCSDRLLVIDGSNLQTLYKHGSGVIVINSTAGLSALVSNLPVKTLGTAIFDVPEVTFQGELDAFWTEGHAPDPETFAALSKLLKASVQVKGNFFTREGQNAAIPEFARRIMTGDVNSYGAYVEPPPRLKRAKQVGVPITYEG